MSEYDTDVLVWSERQSALLRRRAAGELVNEAELDWENIAEEIESVGRSELHAVESLLFQALLHRLKAEAWPESRDAENWLAEARGFVAQARRRFVPSMRRKLDLAGLYADALEAMPAVMDGVGPGMVPRECPVTLEGLLEAREE
jgi:hypothetical protein